MPDEEETQTDDTETQTPPEGTPPSGGGDPPARTLGQGGKPMPDQAVAQAKKEAAARERARVMRELYGTDDAEEIKKIQEKNKRDLEELAAQREEAEKRKRSEMTEVERLTTDNTDKANRITALEAEVKDLRAQIAAITQGHKIQGIASRFVSQNRVKYAMDDYRRYVVSLSSTAQKAIDEKSIEKWFTKFAADNPDMALTKVEPKKDEEEDKPPAPKPRVAAGARPPLRKPVPAPGTKPATGDKTARPKQANSMNRGELKKKLGEMGLKGWG